MPTRCGPRSPIPAPELADTVEALTGKVDVPVRAKEAVHELAADAGRKGREAVGHVGELVAAVPGQLRGGASSVRDLLTGDSPKQPDLRPAIRLVAAAGIIVGVIVLLARRRRR